MADSTLAAIRTKVRRLTRTPSVNQMTDAVLDEYIDTFVQYDFPEHLRLFTLRTEVSFFTLPFVDEYETGDEGTDETLSNFNNKFTNVFDPVYIAGRKAYFTQSREQFYNIYPLNRTQQLVGTGNGVADSFTGTLSPRPVLQGNLTFTAVDADGVNSQVLHDIPVVDADGKKTVDGNLYQPGEEPATAPTVILANNTINYATGAFIVEFPVPPATNTLVNANYRAIQVARPEAMLFWNNKFILRPVPDSVYEVNMEVSVLPTQILLSTDQPELEQWWQYIAYGASKKVFEDRMDMESIQKIMPEFKMQERLVLRRSIRQQTAERTPTIYTEQTSLGAGTGYDNFNGF